MLVFSSSVTAITVWAFSILACFKTSMSVPSLTIAIPPKEKDNLLRESLLLSMIITSPLASEIELVVQRLNVHNLQLWLIC